MHFNLINYLILIFFVFSLRRLFLKLNNGFPIIELTVMLYVLQYLVAPSFEYAYNPEQTMAVPEQQYLNYTFLSVVAFTIGLFSYKSNYNSKKFIIDSKIASQLGRVLVIIGFSSQILMEFLPNNLTSTLNFFVLFKTIGVYALIFSNRRFDKALIIIFSVQIAASSLLEAMLIEFIIFSLFFAMFYSLKYEITNKVKYLFFSIGFLFLIIYQGIKADYRDVVWKHELTTSQKVELLGSLISVQSFETVFSSDIKNNESVIQTMHRLNQGWQTSKVYNHVPSKVDYANGSEFLNDMLSSFLPRFIWQDKRIVNDYKRFNNYTGYNLNRGTAMSMGVIGDFYLNFGFFGTMIMMFLFGFFIARVKRYFVSTLVKTNPINLIWLPFIFSYLIRPGNEFYMVINHLFKSILVLIVVFKFIYPRLNIKTHTRKINF